ncbi:hypothetical protein EVAR_77459_1 [Eumeta japonica]|uniref:Reverse transcriptase RNase H-like domain-containing protein n=1 Tax=Eumeta variegata TaxID=151549 RepID=A0A4C1ZW12_EUMVA|nr:hypothetical protein EVAR_77459_1 [Eumeta japonica]
MILQNKDPPPRVARWALLLEGYDYQIEHRPGSRMKHADALSLYPTCLKTQFPKESKLYPKYPGPYEVIMKKRNDRYAVREIGNTEGPINTTSSADIMKPWVSSEDGNVSSGADG